MKQPPGFVDSALSSHVCQLYKSPLMASILLVVIHLPYMALQMQIGQVVLMIENLRVVILCSLVRR
jgi:hypothetical protein